MELEIWVTDCYHRDMGNLFKAFGKSFITSWKASQEKARKGYLMSQGKMCLRCDGTDINKLKPGLWSKSMFASTALFTGAGKQPKTLNVCKTCGFSWEDR